MKALGTVLVGAILLLASSATAQADGRQQGRGSIQFDWPRLTVDVEWVADKAPNPAVEISLGLEWLSCPEQTIPAGQAKGRISCTINGETIEADVEVIPDDATTIRALSFAMTLTTQDCASFACYPKVQYGSVVIPRTS